MIDKEDKKELVSNEVGNNNDLVHLLQNNEGNNIRSKTNKKKNVQFAKNLAEIIDIQSFKPSALDKFLSPQITHTGDDTNTEKILQKIIQLDISIVNSYKHCWFTKLFSDRCKKEDAVYRAYNCYKHNAMINEDDEIINLDTVKQQMSDCLNQWNAVC